MQHSCLFAVLLGAGMAFLTGFASLLPLILSGRRHGCCSASADIVGSIPTNDGDLDLTRMFESLESELAGQGLELRCDMAGYTDSVF